MVSGHTKNHKIQKIGHPQIMFGGFYKYLAIFNKNESSPANIISNKNSNIDCSMVWASPQREMNIVFKMWVFQRIEKCDREMNARETLSWHDFLLPYKNGFETGWPFRCPAPPPPPPIRPPPAPGSRLRLTQGSSSERYSGWAGPWRTTGQWWDEKNVAIN